MRPSGRPLSAKRRQTTTSAPDHSCQARALLAPAPALQLIQRISPGHLAALQYVVPSKGDGDGRLCSVLTVQGTAVTVLWLPGRSGAGAGAVRLLALPLLTGCLVPGLGLGLGLGGNGFPLGLQRRDASLPVCKRTRHETSLTETVQLVVGCVVSGLGLGRGGNGFPLSLECRSCQPASLLVGRSLASNSMPGLPVLQAGRLHC